MVGSGSLVKQHYEHLDTGSPRAQATVRKEGVFVPNPGPLIE